MFVHTVEICWMNDMQATRATASHGELSGDALSAAVKAVTGEMQGVERVIVDYDDFFDDDRGVYCPDAEIRMLSGNIQEEDVLSMMKALAGTSVVCEFHVRVVYADGTDKVFHISGGTVDEWPPMEK